MGQQEKVLRLDNKHIDTVISIVVLYLIAVGLISDGLCGVCILLLRQRKSIKQYML